MKLVFMFSDKAVCALMDKGGDHGVGIAVIPRPEGQYAAYTSLVVVDDDFDVNSITGRAGFAERPVAVVNVKHIDDINKFRVIDTNGQLNTAMQEFGLSASLIRERVHKRLEKLRNVAEIRYHLPHA